MANRQAAQHATMLPDTVKRRIAQLIDDCQTKADLHRACMVLLELRDEIKSRHFMIPMEGVGIAVVNDMLERMEERA